MVRIINYKKRTAKDGKEFFALELSGGIEMVKSKSTGMYYATAKKTTITSSFDEETCKSLVGTEIPGYIAKVECDPYTLVNEETGEEQTVTSRNMYVPEQAEVKLQDRDFAISY